MLSCRFYYFSRFFLAWTRRYFWNRVIQSLFLNWIGLFTLKWLILKSFCNCQIFCFISASISLKFLLWLFLILVRNFKTLSQLFLSWCFLIGKYESTTFLNSIFFNSFYFFSMKLVPLLIWTKKISLINNGLSFLNCNNWN